ncbi:hypothetical protein FYJ65_01730 [Clostridiales Family XIII bacterium WCA-MUC-591-APC-4B]|uniref:2-isopropylmalate synthase LeuA allosteric (dimerisation) domain-containing protein n=2 Tax=Mogibacterium kristiansenii TaxID=2606708 RepID=A0A6N7X349_9FIRM|nr:hypothetical protein [Mogibacterium kristiansenii]
MYPAHSVRSAPFWDCERPLGSMPNGRLDAIRDALTKTKYDIQYDFITYAENALTVGSKSKAASYVCIADETGKKYWGVGTQPDIILATVNALVSAINRMNKEKKFM